MSTDNLEHIMLIATLGGSREPVIATIKHWNPDRVLFVASPDSVKMVPEVIGSVKADGLDLKEGQYKTVRISDPQDLLKCVEVMHDELEKEVVEWYGRDEHGGKHGCIVDLTGGTKCMSAALALVARPWSTVRFSYVGGEKRDKQGVGVVVSGQERILSSENPWNALGYQVVEEAVSAFDLHAYREGAQRLRDALKNADKDSRKSELNALASFVEGYDLWDKIDYGKAFDKFNQCNSRLNDLTSAFSDRVTKNELRGYIDEAKSRLNQLKQNQTKPSRLLLEDLIANAARRRKEGRHVDAVARLYRATEMAAQLRLYEQYQIDTAKVALKDLPEPMREHLELRAKNGKVELALQDAYRVLHHQGDPLEVCFSELGWADKNSPLTTRNNSIAGHGFTPVEEETSDKLWKGVLELAELSEKEVFRFPELGSGWPTPT